MKIKILLCLVLATVGQFIFAQTQQGYVKTIGRPDKPGVVLGDVVVQAKGMFNPVTSDNSGAFSITVPGKNDGDPIVFLRIQKKGYELKARNSSTSSCVFMRWAKVAFTSVCDPSALVMAKIPLML